MYKKKPANFFANCLRIPLTIFMLLITLCAFTQTSSITGKVIDSSGNPLAGATVKIKGTKQITKTNEQGVFSFENISTASTVIVSYVGYADKELKLSTDRKDIAIALEQK